jgi:hypothetical protein
MDHKAFPSLDRHNSLAGLLAFRIRLGLYQTGRSDGRWIHLRSFQLIVSTQLLIQLTQGRCFPHQGGNSLRFH